MAIVQLKDVTVSRVNSKGFGVKVLESSESNGKTYKTYYSVWFKEPHGLSEGSVVSLSGFLGAKISDPWTDRDGNERTSVELSVNSPRLAGETQTAAATPDVGSAWNTDSGAGYTDETPF